MQLGLIKCCLLSVTKCYLALHVSIESTKIISDMERVILLKEKNFLRPFFMTATQPTQPGMSCQKKTRSRTWTWSRFFWVWVKSDEEHETSHFSIKKLGYSMFPVEPLEPLTLNLKGSFNALKPLLLMNLPRETPRIEPGVSG